MGFARKAWFSVSQTTISNCFKKTGFKVTEVPGSEDLQVEETLAEWNQIIAPCSSNENEPRLTFEDFVHMHIVHGQ